MQNYASLQEAEQEESGVLYHVAEPSRARWNHIDDLDSFFARMYKYHQKHGFFCMMLQESLELIQFLFVISFTVFLRHCIDYPVLFKDQPPRSNSTKVTWSDVVLPPGQCVAGFGWFTYVAIVSAIIVWLWRLVRGVSHMGFYWDIKQFFNAALGVPDAELDNLTWHEVMTKVRAVQLEQQMCIHKRELTELDIYHRILRQQNYMVAMTNKRLIPPRFRVPFVGEVIFWTRGLRYNLQLLLFWGPWAPFENPWHLRGEYRKPNARHELARQLGRHVLWLAFANLLFAPLVLLWQILYAFFNYAELIKREPGSLGMRCWSMYGRLYLRHFNELDHELHTRLCRAHRPATRYLAAFNSPVAAVVGRSLAFMAGAVMAVLILLTLYDDDILYVEHMLATLTALGGIVAICRSVIPDETLAYCPEPLLANVLAHTHYLPNNWKEQAHTSRVRSEFQQLFQYRVVALLEELLSPIITPYVLWRHVHPRVLDIVDFYRNFTVSVVGVGDVCSFAQMDVRKHGNPDWHEPDTIQIPDQYTQAEDGKTELSLVHFHLTNPHWKPPPEALQFVESIEKERGAFSMQLPSASADFTANNAPPQNELMDSLSYRSDAWKIEGPLGTAPGDMSMSTMFLHDRHHQRVGGRGPRPNAVETTPLLSTLPSQ